LEFFVVSGVVVVVGPLWLSIARKGLLNKQGPLTSSLDRSSDCLPWLHQGPPGFASSCLDYADFHSPTRSRRHTPLGKHSPLLPVALLKQALLRYDTPHPCLWALERANHILGTSTKASIEDFIWLFR
jgi:hypothetical protein